MGECVRLRGYGTPSGVSGRCLRPIFRYWGCIEFEIDYDNFCYFWFLLSLSSQPQGDGFGF